MVRGRRLAPLLVLVTAAMSVPLGRATAATPPPCPVPFADSASIHVVATQQIDDRQCNVQVLSQSALGRAVDVRILFPADYPQSTSARYPVLYLFHGTSGRASDWVNFGNAEATTANQELITVMPDAGFDGDGGSWFTDWVDKGTQLGPSEWETFHVSQLIPWVDANLRTVATREGRSIAGLSQGGFGSTTYAARHPDTFVSAASFSGAPEIDRDPDVIIGATGIIQATALFLNQTEPDAMFGPRETNEINWQGHDPSTLMTNLRDTGLFLYTANGQPGPHDSGPNPAASGIEYATHVSTQHFHDHLVAEGLDANTYYKDWGNGTHTWPYWADDLADFVPRMMQTFASPPARSPVDYESVDARWTQWDWSVSLARPAAQQFSRLHDAGPAGFVLDGAGTGTVITPPAYQPGTTKTVTVATSSGTTATLMTVPDTGRLTITVPLSTSVAGVVAQSGTGTVSIQ